MNGSIAIVEDQDTIRAALVETIQRAPDMALFGAWREAEGLLSQLLQASSAPAVILMDIGLPGIDGIEATARVKHGWPECQIVILTVFEDEERIFRSLQAGASGYLLKSTPADGIIAAIDSIGRGGSPMSGSIARKVVESFRRPRPDQAAELSPREHEILDLLVNGLRYKEIAARLAISIDTVRTHIRHIYEKLQVRSRGELTARMLGRRND